MPNPDHPSIINLQSYLALNPVNPTLATLINNLISHTRWMELCVANTQRQMQDLQQRRGM